MRPGNGALAMATAGPRNWSICRLVENTYSDRVSSPKHAAINPQSRTYVDPNWASDQHRKPVPHRMNPVAVLRCMGARFGAIWTRFIWCQYQPASTTKPRATLATPASEIHHR